MNIQPFLEKNALKKILSLKRHTLEEHVPFEHTSREQRALWKNKDPLSVLWENKVHFRRTSTLWVQFEKIRTLWPLKSVLRENKTFPEYTSGKQALTIPLKVHKTLLSKNEASLSTITMPYTLNGPSKTHRALSSNNQTSFFTEPLWRITHYQASMVLPCFLWFRPMTKQSLSFSPLVHGTLLVNKGVIPFSLSSLIALSFSIIPLSLIHGTILVNNLITLSIVLSHYVGSWINPPHSEILVKNGAFLSHCWVQLHPTHQAFPSQSFHRPMRRKFFHE